MKHVVKTVIAFSSLALAGYAYAQTSTTSPASPTTPSSPTATPPSTSGSTSGSASTSTTAPKRDIGTTSTGKAEAATRGGVAQNNTGPNPKEGPSPNSKEGTGTTATAQGSATTRNTRAGGKVTFESLDKDHDGAVSKTEAGAAPEVSQMFSKLDKNRDGKLDNGEFSSHTWK